MTTTVEAEAAAADAELPIDDAPTVRRALWFAAILIVLVLVHTFVVEPVRVRSDSMAPTLPSGAVVVVDKLTFHVRDPRRGDVVVATDPRSGDSIVKRVVAVAGDTVGIDNGLLVVNGETVVEPSIDNREMEGFFFGPDVVPPGHVFLLGDNRANSVDSRAFGPVPVDDIEGRVMGRIWPIG